MTAVVAAPRERWRQLAPWLGSAALAVIVLVVGQPLTAAIAIVTLVMVMGCVLWQDAVASPPAPWPHLLCAGISALSVLGLCASRCGSFAAYATLAGMPTAVVAMIVHLLVAVVLICAGRGHALCRTCASYLVALTGGGSLFYGVVLLVGESWCGACAAIHALMLAQCLALLRRPSFDARARVVLTLLASAGSLNAIYHHRLVSARENDAQALLSYLRSAWSADTPPSRIQPLSADIQAAISAGVALRSHLRALHDLPDSQGDMSSPQPASSERSSTSTASSPGMSALSPTTADGRLHLRGSADANRWGQPQAPITLLLGIDSGCPVCAQEFAQVLELHDLVESGDLQVHLLISYRSPTAQAMASLAYVGGLLGERPLLETLGRFYQHQHDLLLPSDAISVLPASLPATMAIRLLRQQHDHISELLADAENLKQHLGATGDPTMWIETAGASTPQRTFQGLTMSAILRLAVVSLENSGPKPRSEAPTSDSPTMDQPGQEPASAGATSGSPSFEAASSRDGSHNLDR